jgi:hypothetical protein
VRDEIPTHVPQWGARAEDAPDDDGSSVIIYWYPKEAAPPDTPVRILRHTEGDTGFVEVGTARYGDSTYVDTGLERGRGYGYKLEIAGESGLIGGAGAWVVPGAQWFDRSRLNVAIAVPILFLLVLVSIVRARRGTAVSIRRIPGLEAVNEAVGRATEMGRPILFSPGLDEADQPGTIAALAILGQIVGKAAESGTRVIVPNRDPVVMTVAQEIGRQACLVAGRPEFYRDEDIYYATYSQFGYAAAVAGRVSRERPAVNFFMGKFYGEALILAETGYTSGAMQIAGSDSDTQLPFFITTCDYTLIGEELYAASAYLTKEPVLTGSLKGQDIAKAILMGLMGVGLILAILGFDVGSLLR